MTPSAATATATTVVPTNHASMICATGFVDHYEILGLDIWATSEEIKENYRRLRQDYFTSAPEKYRALQAAYLVLVDRDARLSYDTMYRQRIGIPPPPRPHSPTPLARQNNYKEKAGGLSVVVSGNKFEVSRKQPIMSPIEVQPAENKLVAKADQPPLVEKHPIKPRQDEDPNRALKNFKPGFKIDHFGALRPSFVPLPIVPSGRSTVNLIPPAPHAALSNIMEVISCARTRKESNEPVSRNDEDPNWALKHFNPVVNPTIGTQIYWSNIPVALDRPGTLLSKPVYSGEMATFARP